MLEIWKECKHKWSDYQGGARAEETSDDKD